MKRSSPERGGYVRSAPTSLVLAAASLLFSACAGARIDPAPPVERRASDAFLEAWSLGRQLMHGADPDVLALAVESAETARRVEPEWVAPDRFLDERASRPELRLPERYAGYLELAKRGSASAAYLAGRLGGDRADERLAQAVELDPSLGWSWHGLAFRAHIGGEDEPAIRDGQRALELARDPAELALFSWALANYYRSDDDPQSAQSVLRSALERTGPLALRPAERLYLEAELAAAELEADEDADHRRGAGRTLRVLEDPGLTPAERETLALRSRSVQANTVSLEELELAHAVAAASGCSEVVRASILRTLDRAGAAPSARGFGVDPIGWRARLAVAFGAPLASGSARDALEAWLDHLPATVKDERGLPRREQLGALVEAVRAHADASAAAGPSGELEAARAVGQSLIDAGWFREARAWALAMRGVDEEEARALEVSALRGRAALAGVLGLARRVDTRDAFVSARGTGASGATEEREARLRSADALRDEIVALLERVGLADPMDESAESPTIQYGVLGSIVHPGPTFSEEDERLGRGQRGDEVPGLASLFLALGRFALVGNGVGQGGPDATVLRIVHVDQRSGDHLGRPYRGSVFWCEGADVPGRYGRRGAGISGAALHEGFYVDLAMVARDVRRWNALGRRFQGRVEALAAALDTAGFGSSAVDRTETTPALGAADRMRLAVMSSRPGGELRRITTGDLAHVVAVHEEGHLCDRAQWYPLSVGRIFALARFAGGHGFSGARIAEALEERAQLVALCAADDPRVAWVDLLDAAEDAASPALTPHATAYARLLGDLVARLESEYVRGEWEGRGLASDVRWIDQIHRFDAEDLRALAIREARSRGLTTQAR